LSASSRRHLPRRTNCDFSMTYYADRFKKLAL
jgi:hypothetical protein